MTGGRRLGVLLLGEDVTPVFGRGALPGGVGIALVSAPADRGDRQTDNGA